MKYLLLLPLLALLAATTGCVEERHPYRHHRPGYYDDRPRVRNTVVVEEPERPVVRERRVYVY